jgi:RND family efflux transporter MFP subunit
MKPSLYYPICRQSHRLSYGIFLCGMAILLTWGCGSGSKPETSEAKRPVITDVKWITVALSTVDDVYETTGTIKADQISTVASRIMGTVTALYCREGDRVKAGQVLMTIDNQDLTQKVRGAAMALETAKQNMILAETTWRRYRMLYEEKVLSQQEMDQVETGKKVAESDYEQAYAAVEEAGTYRDFAKIKAPIAGTVTSRTITEGSMAVPGHPLLTIEGTASLYVEGFVDEGLVGRLKKGMAVDVVIETEKRQIRGSIRDIVSTIDPRSRTFLVKIGLPPGGFNKGLQSGLFARIRIPVGKKDVLLVPRSVLVQKGQLTGLYAVAPNGLVTYRLVRTGLNYPDGRVEILSGLVSGEQIITEGIQKAVDGGMIQRNPIK